MTLIEPNTPAELIAGDPDQGALRLKLQWHEDRFLQLVQFVRGEKTIDLFEAVGDPQDAPWPQFPPMQQASLEEIDTQPTILGVGQAGTSHWSASLEALCGSGPKLRFDYACRCSGEPEHLGSRYLWDENIENNTDAFAGILFSVLDATVLIAPGDNDTVATCSKEDCWWEVMPESKAMSEPATIRWSYEISLM